MGKQKELKALKNFHGFHPIVRNGKAQDVTNTITFLSTDKASLISGAVWDIDGGVMAGRN